LKHRYGSPPSRGVGILRRLVVVVCLLAWLVPGLGGATLSSSSTGGRILAQVSSGEHHDDGCASHADGHVHRQCSVVHAHACCALPVQPAILPLRTSGAVELPNTPVVASRHVPPPLRPPAARLA
jgi:hypothetical protein